MPELSRFFGIVVRMYFNDHHPAHFHACYGDSEALIEIETLNILRGELPRRALAMVLEWAVLHRQELRMAWMNARGGKPAVAFGDSRENPAEQVEFLLGSHAGQFIGQWGAKS